MLKKIIFLLIILIYAGGLQAQLNIEWQKCYGGTKAESLENEVLQTSDGGFILPVYSKSNDGDIIGNNGGKDICLLKLDKYGKIQWQKSYGGTQNEYLNSLIQTSDGGYIFSANNGNLSSVSTENTGSTVNQNDWIVKLDASGSILWQKFFDVGNEIAETADKGYIVSVFIDTTIIQNNTTTYSKVNKIRKINQQGEIEWQKNIEGSKIVKTTDGNYCICSESNWSKDADIRYWKINEQGDILWERKIGGSGTDFARDVQQTSDGGCVITGVTFSNDGDVAGNHGNGDIWMVKINSSGNIEWQRCIGGSKLDENDLSVLPTNDGGYMITTVAYSVDGDFIGANGSDNGDIWIAKMNKFGIIEWKKCMGGSGEDAPDAILKSLNGGYFISGITNSNDGNVSGFKGGEFDFWIAEINSIGELLWQKCLGGSGVDYFDNRSKLSLTPDGDIMLIGVTDSNDKDVTGNHGESDIWVVKLTSKNVTNSLTEISNSKEKLTIYPNPANNKLTIQFNQPIFKITLIDILGNLVYTNDSGNKEYYIPENLQSGSYMLEILTSQGILHENIFINKN